MPAGDAEALLATLAWPLLQMAILLAGLGLALQRRAANPQAAMRAALGFGLLALRQLLDLGYMPVRTLLVSRLLSSPSVSGHLTSFAVEILAYSLVRMAVQLAGLLLLVLALKHALKEE